MQVLFVYAEGQAPPEMAENLADNEHWNVMATSSFSDAARTAESGRVDAVVVAEPIRDENKPDGCADFDRLIRIIDKRGMAGLILSDQDTQSNSNPASLLETVDRAIPAAEIRGRLAMIERYHGAFARMEDELARMTQISAVINRQFREMDEEMRLAGRLQRNFLPDLSGPIRNVQFAASFHPASPVSGDIYNVFRLTDDISALYLADAVGHGMAAGLLTMFVNRSLSPQQAGTASGNPTSPSQVIGLLNDALVNQSLPECQFVTACYGLINHQESTFQFARGGHPYPILIPRHGKPRELPSTGGLLGIFPDDCFTTTTAQLQPGDKVLLYTDGIELACPGGAAEMIGLLEDHNATPIEELLQHLESRFVHSVDVREPRDDLTLLGFEMLK